MENLSKIINMFFYGLSSISHRTKRNYYRQIPKVSLPTTYERWCSVGLRLKNATHKVVEQSE